MAEETQPIEFSYSKQDEWAGKCGMDCDTAKRQSPIDIPKSTASVTDDGRPLLQLNQHKKTIWTLKNTGTAAVMSINKEADRPILTGGALKGEYKFDHFTFHWGAKEGEGSEHSYDKANFDGEIHYQFTLQGDPAEGEDPVVILCLNMKMRSDGGKTSMMGIQEKLGEIKEFQASTEIPNSDFLRVIIACFTDSDYFQYQGSLCHPPCTENVTYIVFEKPGEFSNIMFEHFREMKGSDGEPIKSNHREKRFELGDRAVTRTKHVRRKRSDMKSGTKAEEVAPAEPGAPEEESKKVGEDEKPAETKPEGEEEPKPEAEEAKPEDEEKKPEAEKKEEEEENKEDKPAEE
ncbi:carbonic anhydrase 2-like [Symsagittifera roscoffensis]|uniref:carbonic anhydrase 2-like n=1 Tax=Symsagittifera roscoffensis TaxID=84072 RepID=UPI00307C677F